MFFIVVWREDDYRVTDYLTTSLGHGLGYALVVEMGSLPSIVAMWSHLIGQLLIVLELVWCIMFN